MERRLGFVDGVVEGVERYCERSAQPNLREHLSHISLADLETAARDGRGENGKGDGKGDGPGRGGPDDLVTLSTLHGAKGLEFPVVFLIGLEEGLLPHDRTLNPQATDHVTTDVSEERRLCYVGMTRARDELYLSRARTRRVRGKLRDRTPSRFLDALPEEELDVQDLSAVASNEEVTSMLDEMRAKLGW
jgi:superfamily I DNA/RNA helicase